MKQVLILNNGTGSISVAGGILPVNSQRWVDAADITPGLKKYVVATEATASADSSGDEALAFDPESFLARSLKEMEEELGTLSKTELEVLKTTENAVVEGTPRKNVIDAIDVALIAAQA